MIIPVPSELVELAQIFKKHKATLYLVGGYVRNKILGFPDSYNVDIDVCSSMKPEKVKEILEFSGYSVNYMNQELGVVEIKKNLRIEHATFRKEKYAFAGVHIPDNVEFIKDLNVDAERRDFRCNAIYYDILNEQIVDPFDGVSDIKNKIIRTTLEPEKVFKDDAERILRMVRFACTLGFQIERETYEKAKENVHKIEFIGEKRRRDEFSRIVLADTKFDFITDIKYAHARGLTILADLGALKFLLPTLEKIRLSDVKEDRGKPLFEHITNVFAFSKPEVRLSALLHDVGKFHVYSKYGNFNGADEFTPVLIEENLGENTLGFSKKIIERVKRVVKGNEFNQKCLATTNQIKRFILENSEEISLILALKNAVALDKSWFKRESISAKKIQKVYDKMLEKHTPLKLSELKIDGNDIKDYIKEIVYNAELKPKIVGDILEKLLWECVKNPYFNNREKLFRLTEKIVLRNKKQYVGE